MDIISDFERWRRAADWYPPTRPIQFEGRRAYRRRGEEPPRMVLI